MGPTTRRCGRSRRPCVKQPATSLGMGAVAGMASRYRKSPVGWVRWKVIVFGSGVSIPEIVWSGDLALPSMPSITPS